MAGGAGHAGPEVGLLIVSLSLLGLAGGTFLALVGGVSIGCRARCARSAVLASLGCTLVGLLLMAWVAVPLAVIALISAAALQGLLFGGGLIFGALLSLLEPDDSWLDGRAGGPLRSRSVPLKSPDPRRPAPARPRSVPLKSPDPRRPAPARPRWWDESDEFAWPLQLELELERDPVLVAALIGALVCVAALVGAF